MIFQDHQHTWKFNLIRETDVVVVVAVVQGFLSASSSFGGCRPAETTCTISFYLLGIRQRHTDTQTLSAEDNFVFMCIFYVNYAHHFFH
jgi:hypothetical protein